MGLEREQAIREKYTLTPEQFFPHLVSAPATHAPALLKEALAKAASIDDN